MYRFAVATAATTFVLLLVGGVVHGTGSSLACPDWPLCYGSAFPEMTGGVLFEHSHRLLATGVGIMTIVLTVLGWRARKRDRALGPLTTLALVAVIVQGVLGGITVLLRLPTAVSTAHLALSMAFFSLLLYIAWRVRKRPVEASASAAPPRLHRWILVATIAVFVQIVIGGLVRHTGAGLACLDVPLCGGELWPAAGAPMAKLQMIHRFVGAAVGLLVIVVGIRAFVALRGARAARWLALAAPLLVVVQIALGVVSVLSMLGLWQVTAHLGVGALLLGDLWLLSLLVRPASSEVQAGRRSTLRDMITLTKPRITLLSVATAAAGYVLAGRGASGAAFAITLVGTLFLVGSANTLNMYLERDVDARMERTRRRPLPAGKLAPSIALWFGVAQALFAVPLLTFGANALTGLLGAIALLLYVLVYTPLKQRTTFSLLVGAIPGAMPPLLGWTAASGRVSLAALALFGVIFFWQVPHFLAIAMFRREDYVAAGLKVLPAVRGDQVTRQTIVGYLVLQVAVTLALVPLGVGGAAYGVGAALLGAAMLALGLFGLARRSGARWARGLFFASIVYLPILFALLVAP